MKAILLAGGKGTRLRPLTIHTPKPIVPIFNRAFLHYQIDLLKQVPEIDEVILSLNYQPRRIEEMFGDGADLGIKIRYVVEPVPLGTAGAIKYAGDKLTESVVVFNGDVMTQLDLAAVIRLHRERQRPRHDRPDAGRESLRLRAGRNRRRRQHPAVPREAEAGGDHDQPHQRRHLRPRARHLRSDSERSPVVDRAKLLPFADRARRDVRGVRLQRLLDRHRHAGEVHAGPPGHHGWPLHGAAVCRPRGLRGRGSRRTRASRTAPPSRARCSSTRASLVKAGARVGPYAVLGRQTQVEEEAVIERAILWPNCRIGSQASIARRGARPAVPHGTQRVAQRRRRARRQDDAD